jgi:hypothetical protein
MLDPLLFGTADVEEADADRALAAEESFRVFSTPDLNVAGQDYTGVVPPDTVGDVGRNHYIQMTNHPSGSGPIPRRAVPTSGLERKPQGPIRSLLP